MTTNCSRSDCDESFSRTSKAAEEIAAERHLAEDHDAPWVEIRDYPRPPEQR